MTEPPILLSNEYKVESTPAGPSPTFRDHKVTGRAVASVYLPERIAGALIEAARQAAGCPAGDSAVATLHIDFDTRTDVAGRRGVDYVVGFRQVVARVA